jgi:hypothetical protein
MDVFSQKLSQPEMAALAGGEASSDELAATATAEFVGPGTDFSKSISK